MNKMWRCIWIVNGGCKYNITLTHQQQQQQQQRHNLTVQRGFLLPGNALYSSYALLHVMLFHWHKQLLSPSPWQAHLMQSQLLQPVVFTSFLLSKDACLRSKRTFLNTKGNSHLKKKWGEENCIPSIHWDHTLCRVLVLPKQSTWLFDTILDRSPLRHRIPASWHSFCRPRKDDRPS